MRVLLIEDDNRVAGPLMEGLSRFGFTVEHARTGAAGLAAGEAEMVLLDLGLPDMDGIDVCRTLRLRSQVPIIMISARNDEVDRVLGLELGADDYLSKPFGVRELVARIRAVFRRAGPAAAEPASAMPVPGVDRPGPVAHPQQIGPLVIDRRGRQVHLHQTPVGLAPKEFDLLAYLADDPGAVRTRQQILDAVWEPNYFGPTKTLDVHVAALRRKLGDPAWIDNIRSVGFRLTPPADAAPTRHGEESTEGGDR
ncbi:DNA-binding response OmpR family regulator [Streptomyces griseochromogenes]|uniref:Sensory transduction protein RegX3 n=1 Tax=Streptomyces griseochromogenes TaxID=68214 RepID=A0A1B1B3M4_9ACTN|nr:response regulator transcription factor [Streptomyces griseochromogenes]ANP53415.1 DNA-binding response regulator [Streptomyces griseochromogenes]MBP2055112.1 DNA-binding response OmpR family regulator [Streptomyces griseochromogenes]